MPSGITHEMGGFKNYVLSLWAFWQPASLNAKAAAKAFQRLRSQNLKPKPFRSDYALKHIIAMS